MHTQKLWLSSRKRMWLLKSPWTRYLDYLFNSFPPSPLPPHTHKKNIQADSMVMTIPTLLRDREGLNGFSDFSLEPYSSVLVYHLWTMVVALQTWEYSP